MRFGSSNPIFRKLAKENAAATTDFKTATYSGVAAKSIYFLFLTVVGAALGLLFIVKSPESYPIVLISSFIIALISGFIAFLRPNISKIAGTFYCVAEGLVLGALSLIFEAMAPGAVLSAVVGTFAVVLVVSALYLTGIIKVTSKFLRALVIFSISFIAAQLIIFILSLAIPNLVNAFGGYGLITSAVSCLLAVFYLFFDLEIIKSTVEGGQPKFLEWFAAFGLVYTTLWVYIEILRLVAIFARRD